jgi:hypothetical protein
MKGKASTPGGDGICDVPFCHQPLALVYLDHEVCEGHWQKDCSGEISLRKIFAEKEKAQAKGD